MVSYYRAFAPKSEAVNYMDYRATLTSFEVTTVTSMDSQEPACCDDGHLPAS